MAEPKIEMPGWFDPVLHVHNGRGVYERGTGLALAEDGIPIAGMIRAQRLAQAGKASDPLGLVSDDLIAAEGRAQKVVTEISGRKLKQEAQNAE